MSDQVRRRKQRLRTDRGAGEALPRLADDARQRGKEHQSAQTEEGGFAEVLNPTLPTNTRPLRLVREQRAMIGGA